jgi:acyl-CoA synthetase (AMP-forming)/AMP-acid ligase II
VISVPDDTWGEAVHAIVILKDGRHLLAEDLIAHCHRLIAATSVRVESNSAVNHFRFLVRVKCPNASFAYLIGRAVTRRCKERCTS